MERLLYDRCSKHSSIFADLHIAKSNNTSAKHTYFSVYPKCETNWQKIIKTSENEFQIERDHVKKNIPLLLTV